MARINKKKYPWFFDMQTGTMQLQFLTRKGVSLEHKHAYNTSNDFIRRFHKTPFNNSYCSRSFIDDSICNYDKIKHNPLNDGHYNLLYFSGDHAAVIVDDGHVDIMVWQESTIKCYGSVNLKTFESKGRAVPDSAGLLVVNGKKITTKKEAADIVSRDFFYAIAALLFKQYATIKTKKLKPKQKLKEFHCRYKNESIFEIDLCDLNWYTESLQSHPFAVRGHWRNQRFGPGNKHTKLIYIDPIIKSGYKKGAYRLKQA